MGAAGAGPEEEGPRPFGGGSSSSAILLLEQEFKVASIKDYDPDPMNGQTYKTEFWFDV